MGTSSMRVVRAITAIALACAFAWAPAAHAAQPSPAALRTAGLANPLGIDDPRPSLSWQMRSGRRGAEQVAYEIRAASSESGLSEPDLWDSGRVESSRSHGVAYAGRALASRDRVFWQVRVWDGSGGASDWSAPARFEMGLLDAGDWTAKWIGSRDWLDREPEPVVVSFPERTARYVRIDVTRRGLPIVEGSSLLSRIQLAEIQVADSAAPDENLAAGGAVQASDVRTYAGNWEPRFLTDGRLATDAAPRGYTSNAYSTRDVTKPAWILVDLGSAKRFDQIRLFGRTDVTTDDGQTPNFPSDFSVQTGDAPDGPFEDARSVSDQAPPPAFHVDLPPLPLFARQFAAHGDVRSARLYATGLGVYAATLNGEPVGDGVLEPPDTDYRKRVVYTTYDVTKLVRAGDNTLGVRLGNGAYNVPPRPDRYAKYVATMGVPKLRMQLEVTYADGTTERIASGEDWRTHPGPVTYSGWYGGEDHDARLEPAGWQRPGAALDGWRAARETTAPAAGSRMVARMSPPIVPVDRVGAVAITEPEPGTYVFDLGRNVSGWQELRVQGPAGTQVTMKPGERLGPDGHVDQSTMIRGGETWPPILDRYTLAGTDAPEAWHPEFVYHGFRYVEVTGLPQRPGLDAMSAIVLRAANRPAGTFSSSSHLLNRIHGLIGAAIAGNMFSILTDCPDREKLGWLEEMHLEFGPLSRNFDVSAYYREQLRNMADAQYANGFVPNIAPEYVVFGGDVHDDPNWGSAVIMGAWKLYRAYGDAEPLRTYYGAMQRYYQYLYGQAKDGILDYGLGDWAAIDTSTPTGVAATFALHQDAVTLARIADTIGEDADARGYREQAAAIADAFNARYLDAGKGTYATGSQAADAFALDMGVVPAGSRQAVLDHLVASIRAAGDHLTVGEIALPSALRSLSAGGRDDVIADIALQTTSPSYGYQVVQGATSLTEYWDGPTGYGSQNHWMLGAIDEWLSGRLAGIDQAVDSVAYDDLVVRPAVVGGLTHAEATYEAPAGEVRSAWRREGATFQLDVTVPANTHATVSVPLWEGAPGRPSATAGARYVGERDGRALYEVGAGEWQFVTQTTERLAEDREQLSVNAAAGEVPVVEGYPISARFRVTNLEDHEVTVRPEVAATAGFSAKLAQPEVTIPAGQSVTLEPEVSVTDAGASTGRVTLTAGDASDSAALRATDDVVRVATMSASSTLGGSSPAFTNDGSTDSEAWSNGVGGWNDGTKSAFPDTLTATWTRPVRLARVRLFTLDSAKYPASKTGVRDFDVEARVGDAWVPVASVTANAQGMLEWRFEPIEASALRLVVHDSNDHTYSRVIELEGYAS